MASTGKYIGVQYLLIIITCLFLGSCATTYPPRFQRYFKKELHNPFYANHFTGLMILEAESGDTLYANQADRYFTPASNTKIATLFTSLELLPDSLPALRFRLDADTLRFMGTGDPSFLHPYFRDSTALRFLSDHEHIIWYTGNYQDDRFAPGWAWEDYPYAFSTERSVLPIFGNTVQVIPGQPYKVIPPYFSDSTSYSDIATTRIQHRNQFRIKPPLKDTLTLPFISSTATTIGILESIIGGPVKKDDAFLSGELSVLKGISRDSVCKKMMVDSDNFLAEQLMVLASSRISDTLSFNAARDRMLDGPLVDLDNPPRWVDGSGLSRYNLFTPKWITGVLHKMYKKYPREQLFNLFPVGGESGTLAEWYGDPVAPYIYAKSGTLGNNYNLSGYLITDSGKTLIFSIMNNHFRNSSRDVRKHLDQTLRWLKTHY